MSAEDPAARPRRKGRRLEQLLKRASALVAAIEADEAQQGGLLGRDTLRLAGELRNELWRWQRR